MPRIPEALIESIKRDVPCVSVLETQGLVFAAHGGGGDVVCCCPFHDDKTPSLIVSVNKNLWRCHGACGIGGDVIALIQKLNGVSFRHAVEIASQSCELRATSCELSHEGKKAVFSFAAAGAASGENKSKLPKLSTTRLLPCPLDYSVDDARLNQQVVDYYASRLLVPGNAGRGYLLERGLDDAELIRRFSLGFADRSLGLRLPNKQRKEGAELRQRLEKLGWFRSSGHEHFAGSVVIPIHGDDGSVTGMYGRKVTERLRSGTPLHTYLPGKHRGIWNAGPGLINDGAVVICEALIDALSFWISGIRNVTAAYGVNGFTDDHWSALSAGKAKDVFIAFDADAAGDVAAEKLAEQLIYRGFTAFRVVFPADQDANAVLMAADGGRSALAGLIGSASWLGGSPRVIVTALPLAAKEEISERQAVTEVREAASSFAASLPKGVTVRHEGADLFATIGTRRYRVRGWNTRRTAETLMVALRLSVDSPRGERQHYDRFDLYQTRQRTAFIAAAAEECGLSADVLKADVGTLISVVETAEIAAAQEATTRPSDPTADMTDEDKAAALKLLHAPDLTNRIVADLTRCGLVGEDVNKLVAYIAASSRKIDQPLAVVVQSSSAAGKSTLMDRVLSLMPPEDVRQYSAISGKSPFYLGTANLKHRILAIAEEEGARKASYALKLLQSDGFLSMAATGKDPESGKLVTHDYRVEGPVMLMLTTTAIDVDPELLNRCLVLTVDEEPAQTAAIQQAQRAGKTLAGISAKLERAAVELLHQNAQRLLRPLVVVNPHATSLSFAASQTRLRRDHAKYLALIDAVTFLHQHQRTVKSHTFVGGKTIEYIEVTAADIAVANQLASAVLARSLDDLPPQTRMLWNGLCALVQAEAQRTAQAVGRVSFDRRMVTVSLGWSYKQVRQHLDRLVAEDFVVVANSGLGQVTRYRLVEGLEATGRGDLQLGNGFLPTPMTTTLPIKEGVCPNLAHVPWARSNDGQTPSFGVIFRGSAHKIISRRGDIRIPFVTPYMGVVDRAASAS